MDRFKHLSIDKELGVAMCMVFQTVVAIAFFLLFRFRMLHFDANLWVPPATIEAITTSQFTKSNNSSTVETLACSPSLPPARALSLSLTQQ